MPARRLHRAFALVVTLALALSGCSLRTSNQSSLKPVGIAPVNAPALPASSLKPLADRDRDVQTQTAGLGAHGSTVISVGNVVGNVSVPFFRWSEDAGATWNDGSLTYAAAEKTQIAEQSLGLVAFANNTWVSLGEKGETVLAWTSADGRSWDRAETTGIDGERAVLHDITATEDSFVVAGALVTPDGEHSVPYVWTSTDGIAWTAVEVTKERGVLSSVIVRDGTLVAVGDLPLDQTNAEGRFQYAAAYTSTDAGKSWTKAKVPEPSDTRNFYAELNKVVSTSTGFVAAGYYHANQYQPYVLTSPDGVSWSVGPAVTATLSYGWVRDLLVVKDQVILLTGDTNQDESAKEIHLYRLDQGGWTDVDLPKELEEPYVTDALGVADAALVSVGWSDPQAHTAIWRTTDAGQTWKEQVSEAPESFEARVSPVGLMLAEGTEVAYGSAQGYGVIWKRDPKGFTAPTVVLDGDRRAMDGMAAGPQSWLMWGREDGHAWVAVSTDQGATWEASRRVTFSATSQYAWSVIREAIWLGDRWLVVGAHSDNGTARTSALAYTSTDGLTWQPGKPTKSNVVADDGFNGTPVVSDLDGVYAQRREMANATAVGSDAIAVGWTTKGDVQNPAWWTSSGKGRTWLLKQPLPTPGVTSAVATGVSVEGDRITILGVYEVPGSIARMPCTWVSSNAGASWTFTPHEDWGRASYLNLEENGKELISVVGSYDRKTISAWRSVDGGVTWTKTPVEVPGQATGVEVSVRSSLVVNGELHLLVQVYNRLDGTSVVQTVPLK